MIAEIIKWSRVGNQKQSTIVGLDIGGTKTAVVERTFDGMILQRRELPTVAKRKFSFIFSRLTPIIEATILKANAGGRSIRAISVSIGGPLDVGEGVLIDPPHLPGFHGIHLKEKLEECFPGIPVFIEHDGNAGALAEFHFGIGKDKPGIRNLIFLTLGTGLGAGIIANGQLIRGACGMAGEVGHIRIAADGPEGFGKEGSWEGYCSGAGMVRLAKYRFPDRGSDHTTIADLIDAALCGDSQALSVVQESGKWLGRGIALLIDILNPEVISLGSLAVVLGDYLLDPMMETISKEVLPRALNSCTILPTPLGKQIGDVASLMAAYNAMELLKEDAA